MATGKLVMSMTLLAFPMQMAVAQQPEPEQTAAPDAQSQQATAMSGAATGSTRSGPERRFTGADLFDLAIASDPQISPTGATLRMCASRTTSCPIARLDRSG